MCMTQISSITFIFFRKAVEKIEKCCLQGSLERMINIQQHSSVMSHSTNDTVRINGLLLKIQAFLILNLMHTLGKHDEYFMTVTHFHIGAV